MKTEVKEKKLAKTEKLLVDYIKARHTGEQNGIYQRELCEKLGLKDTRELREIIFDLVTKHHIPICCTTDSGVFWPASEEEAERALKQLYMRGANNFLHMRALEKAIEKEFSLKPSLFGLEVE